jgi:hypothetical protein
VFLPNEMVLTDVAVMGGRGRLRQRFPASPSDTACVEQVGTQPPEYAMVGGNMWDCRSFG